MKDDTISRKAALDAIFGRSHEIIKMRIGNLPSAQPERKRGRWNCSDDMYESAVCSVCGWDTTEPWDHIRHWFNYCPNCGADMREVDDGQV